MKKKIQLVIILNVISYIDCFYFLFNYENLQIKNNWFIIGLFALSPYLFLTLTSIIIPINYKREYKYLKVQSVIDWTIRLIAFSIVFNTYILNYFNDKKIYISILLCVLAFSNSLLEFIIYYKIDKLKGLLLNEEVISDITDNEKYNLKNMGKAITLGMKSFFVLCAVSGAIMQLMFTNKNIFFSIVCVLVWSAILLWAVFKIKEKNYLYFRDKVIAKQKYIDEVTIFIFSVITVILSSILVYKLFESDISRGIITTSVVFCFFPSMNKTRKMAKRYNQVKKKLDNQFDYYYENSDD